MSEIKSYISGIAHHVPDRVVTNDDLSKRMDTSDEWIKTRTGIGKRHTVGLTGQGPSDLAVKASEKLFNKDDINKTDIDFVVVATSTPDRFIALPFSASISVANFAFLAASENAIGLASACTELTSFSSATPPTHIRP